MDTKSEQTYAELNAARLYYEIKGSGENVVLIHGGFGDRRYWDGQFEELARHFRVLRYDIRGFGKSSLPAECEPYSNREDLAALLELLDISDGHLVGYSMGSRIAVNFTLSYPGRSKSLVLVGPVVSGFLSASFQQWRSAVSTILPVLEEKGQIAAADHVVDIVYADLGCDAETIARVRKIMRGYSFWHYTHNNPSAGFKPPAIERLREICIPALVVTAERDLPFCQETAKHLANTLGNVELKVLRGAGHFMPMEKPEEINRLIIQFLKSRTVN